MTKERIRISLPHRGFGMSMSNMIEIVFGEAEAKLEGNWIEVEETEPGHFEVVDDNMTVKDGDWITESTNLGLCSWDEEVEDLDAGDSDESQCFGMSSHLKWKDVDIYPGGFTAPSVERIIEALNHVAMCAWCPGDI